MVYFSVALAIALIISIFLSYKSFFSNKTAIQTIQDMGQGWNLGNSFECFNASEEIYSPDEQIKLFGNAVPTELIVTRIKKYGFKTIRFPITWIHFIDDLGNVNSEWMSRVREVVDWIINNNMYCIINIHHDGLSGNWLTEGLKVKSKYINLWTKVANEFRFYDDHLIFESMNEIEYKIADKYDYKTLVIMNQAFVDTVRKSGGNNEKRLLLISGMSANFELTTSSEFQMPIDPSNKLAVSIHYYLPLQFCLEPDDNNLTWTHDNGVHEIPSVKTWGNENNYEDLVSNFETMKKKFTDKGIAVILGEVGVLTEQQKEPESIREYLYAVFSMSADYNGIMSCLWDTSKNTTGNMNYFNREIDQWYDEKIKINFKKISKKKYVKPTDFYRITNIETIDEVDASGNLMINIGFKKVSKIIFNARIIKNTLYDVGFGIVSSTKNGDWIAESFPGDQGKKQYDGSYTFTFDCSNKEFYTSIKIEKFWGNEFIILNYLTLEYEENNISFNYKEYKKALDF